MTRHLRSVLILLVFVASSAGAFAPPPSTPWLPPTNRIPSAPATLIPKIGPALSLAASLAGLGLSPWSAGLSLGLAVAQLCIPDASGHSACFNFDPPTTSQTEQYQTVVSVDYWLSPYSNAHYPDATSACAPYNPVIVPDPNDSSAYYAQCTSSRGTEFVATPNLVCPPGTYLYRYPIRCVGSLTTTRQISDGNPGLVTLPGQAIGDAADPDGSVSGFSTPQRITQIIADGRDVATTIEVLPDGSLRYTTTTTVKNSDGTSSTSTESATLGPTGNVTAINNNGAKQGAASDTPPLEFPCGAPGKPPCGVKVDESGMPSSTQLATATQAVHDSEKAATDLVASAASPDGKSTAWSFSFALPSACNSYVIDWLQNLDISPCRFQSTFHDVMGFAWVLATTVGMIGLASRHFV